MALDQTAAERGVVTAYEQETKNVTMGTLMLVTAVVRIVLWRQATHATS